MPGKHSSAVGILRRGVSRRPAGTHNFPVITVEKLCCMLAIGGDSMGRACGSIEWPLFPESATSVGDLLGLRIHKVKEVGPS